MKRELGSTISAASGALVILLGSPDQGVGLDGRNPFAQVAQAQRPVVAPRVVVPPDHRHRYQDLEPLPPPPEASPEPPPPSSPDKTIQPSGAPWLFADSNSRYLTNSDLRGLTSDQLWIARNEIFARRGYRFHTGRGIAYGQSLGSWYIGADSDGSRIYSSFNDYERHNVELIKQYERRR